MPTLKARILPRAAALILAVAAFTGSASAQNAAVQVPLSGHQLTWVRISAFTDAPLSEADVAVYDTAGRRLFQKPRATNNQGVFPAHVRALPSDFRVTVSGIGFTLSADVRNFDPIHANIIYVNPVTTIVSRLLDRSHGQLNLQEAQTRVRGFLGLPTGYSLGAALRRGKSYRSRYFSPEAFLAEAARHSGVNPFTESLLSEMLTQPDAVHPFTPAPQSSLGGVFSFFAEHLADSALSWAEGEGIGWAAESAGIDAPGATEADIANLQAGLTDLQSSVDELSQQVQELTSEVLAKLTQTEYYSIVVPAMALASQVDGVENRLVFFNQGCPPLAEGTPPPDPDPTGFCTTEKATVISELSDLTIIQSYETLSTYLLDNPTLAFNGLIHLFSQSLGQSVRFFRPADSTKMQNMFDYWDSVETEAANLKVELLHVNKAQENPGGIAELTGFLGNTSANPPTSGEFQNTHANALKLMFPPVPVNTVINTKDHMMWATNYPRPDLISCSQGSPGYFQYAPYPITSELVGQWDGFTGWSSPDLSVLQALIDGWSGSNPMTWLIDQSKAEGTDSPASPGFTNIVNLCTPGGLVWSQTTTGQNSGKNQIYYLVDMTNGSVNSKDGVAAPQCDYQNLNSCYVYNIPFHWQLISRGLPRGEQYYWYP